MENNSAMELWKNVYKNTQGQTILHLNGRRLTMVPNGVTEMVYVEVLNLQINELTELPTSINQLKNLKELNLTFNRLTKLPESIGQLINLSCLNVSCNRLSAIPTSIKYLKKLQKLYLSNNMLQELPEDITVLEELTVLNLNFNLLLELPRNTKRLRKLKELYLSHNRLKELPKELENLKHLEILNVYGNLLTSEAMRNLIKLMAKKTISVSGCKPQEEHLNEDHKTTIFKDKVKEEGVSWNLKEVAACITFSPMAVSKPKQMTCSRWSPKICSPSLAENESLVSNVIELSCEDGPLGAEFHKDVNEKVTVRLSHSASDLKGYELVIKELVDLDNNEWKDLDTRNVWKASDLPDRHYREQEVPDWMFPFAEAEITNCSSFAVIWRLKSFTFYKLSPQASDFTCRVTEFPGVSVTIPHSSVPSSENFSVTIKLQEAPSDLVKEEGVFVGPILHISCSQEVKLLNPAKITIPLTLRDNRGNIHLPSSRKKILVLNAASESAEWADITEELNVPADLQNGIVAFEVNHFSKFWAWATWLLKGFTSLPSLASRLYKQLNHQHAEFLAFLIEVGGPSSTLGLILCCCPRHLKEQEKKNICTSGITVRHQGEGNSQQPLYDGESIFVDLRPPLSLFCQGSKADEEMKNREYHLEFLQNRPNTKSDLAVSVGTGGIPQVEFSKRQESEEEKVCILSIFPTTQGATVSTSPEDRDEAGATASTSQEDKGEPGATASTSPEDRGEAGATAPTSQEDRGEAGATAPTSQEDKGEPSVPPRCSTVSIAKEISKQRSSKDIDNSPCRQLNVTLLADEWGSKHFGVSTMNRLLAINLAKLQEVKVQVTFLVPMSTCSDQEKLEAATFNVDIVEVQKRLSMDPLTWLCFPTKDLKMDVVVGHDVMLGQQPQIIKEEHGCRWVQVMHTDPKELSSKGQKENKDVIGLCESADLVMTVGPKLKGVYSGQLRGCGKERNVFEFTPGIMEELTDLQPAPDDSATFKVLVFGRGDPEDFKLKGCDIAAEAFACHELKGENYCLVFVCAPEEKLKVKERLSEFGIPEMQLYVRTFKESREELKGLFREVDLAIMPSRTEGFGLTALEALSAGLPILVSNNSGFAHVVKELPFGGSYIVNSDDPKAWAEKIKDVRKKDRAQRLKEIKILRSYYEEKYSWQKQCTILFNKIWNMVHGEFQS